jgi:phosphoadenosine phosphosulfate reductase
MRTALQFSGGKDSLALLMHMRALWPFLTVIHVDSGDLPLSARMMIEKLRLSVPHFKTIKADSLGYRAKHGDPTGRDWTRCCNENIWMPMNTALHEMGFKQVIRGSKACDPHIHVVYPGEVVEGMLYTFPLWHWSDKDVEDYLGPMLPDAYRNGSVGMPDCATCPVEEACGGRTKDLWKAAA